MNPQYLFMGTADTLLETFWFLADSNNSLYAFSTIIGVTAFSCFWSILELFEQRECVRKGWFPRKKDKQNSNLS